MREGSSSLLEVLKVAAGASLDIPVDVRILYSWVDNLATVFVFDSYKILFSSSHFFQSELRSMPSLVVHSAILC